jgi:hypothetical protein
LGNFVTNSVTASSVVSSGVTATTVTAGAVNATTSNTSAITGVSSAANAQAIFGRATATGASPTYGVLGGADGPAGVGVWGFSNGGAGYGVQGKGAQAGVFGWSGVNSSNWNTFGSVGVQGDTANSNGIAVLGTTEGGTAVMGVSTSGFAFQATGDATQSRGNGGWIKAMAYLTPIGGGMSITRCYNSQMTGAAVSTPPCGITIISHSPGSTVLDLGFLIQDRFYNFSCSSWNCAIGGDVVSNSNPTQLLVQNYDIIARQLADTAITVFVY